MKKDNINVYLTIVVIGLVASWWLVGSIETLILNPKNAIAQTTSSVEVTAEVIATISCSTDQSATDFTTLTTGSVTTSTPNASTTMSCANVGGGCVLYVKDTGGGGNPGLWNSAQSYLIASASSTLSAGTEGYGINATTTATGGGSSLIIPAHYRLGSDVSTSTVGGLTITNQTIASTNSTSSDREIVVRHKAAISSITKAGNYADTITYECSVNE